jgi:uncharacterized protein
MRILLDADGCPVVDIAIRCAARHGVPVTLFCDEAHRFDRAGADTVTVATGADSADLCMANRITRGDIAVTQDYGLAALCLARQARVLNQDGRAYTNENIDGLLQERHNARKIRRAGGRLTGPLKRMPGQDVAFEAALERLLEPPRDTEASSCRQ